eukprot:tig00000829_g4684.t1
MALRPVQKEGARDAAFRFKLGDSDLFKHATLLPDGRPRSCRTPVQADFSSAMSSPSSASTGRITTRTPRPAAGAPDWMRGLTRGRRSALAVLRCSARPLLQQLLPRPARRPARCFSFVDSRLCAGLGATCRSARFLARRPAGCFSFVDSRLRAGPGATFLSSDAAFPPATPLAWPPTWCRRPRRHPTYPPRHPARLAQPPALPL